MGRSADAGSSALRDGVNRARNRAVVTAGRGGTMETDARDRLTLAAFGGAVLIGGSNFVAVKFSNAELAPLYGAAVRFTAAALLSWLLVRALSLPVPRGRALVGASIFGALGIGISYGFIYFALLEISAGMAAVIMATVPLFTLLLATLHGQERLSVRGLAGGVLAIAGIGVLSLRSIGGELSVLHVLAAVVASVSAAESSVVVKGFPRTHPVTTNAVGLTAGAVLLWAASLVASEPWQLPQTARTWAAVSWLVVAGSVGLFYLVLFLIGRWTASAAVYCLTLMPVVAVTLGAILADEPITAETLAGALIVLAAVYVGAIRRPAARRAPVPAEEPG
jgi:drug/metabolite transporter (DMT)-like permease